MIFLLILFALSVVLQIFLSRQQSRWLGLILPGLSFLWSLVMVFNAAALPGASLGSTIWMIVLVLLLGNISTLLLLAIYAGCRSGIQKRREMERMKAQDLE